MSMQKLLRRTVTVGKKYALYIWTTYVVVLTGLLIWLMYAREWGPDAFRAACVLVVAYSIAGIIVSVMCLFQIEEKARQIREDLNRIEHLVFRR